MISCRRATNADVDLFRSIRLRALQDCPDAFGSTYEAAIKRDHASWRDQLLSTSHGIDRNTQLAFAAEKCVGLAALYRDQDTASGEIVQMWVAPDHRGSPAASMLLGQLRIWAAEVGIHHLNLSVTNTNGRAIKFYENQGFLSTGECVSTDRNRELQGILMTLNLASRRGG
ncbi:GNAT family N-acetyltransferase [Novipirellula caenicola]|uniref:N-acetyltransferase domain-containing protein n=1 Tax=Novipirellula caenicola TaxID=1536901 RepID=A0ABP9VWN4_9BACT